MTGNGGEANKTAGRRMPHAWLWVMLGIAGGLVLAALFLAYGQPELLLEQLNLRYCG